MLIHVACLLIVALVGLGFLALGLAAVALALRTLWFDANTLLQCFCSKAWQATTGTITRSLVTQLSGGRRPTFAARIAYAYTVANRQLTGTRPQFDSWWFANVGGRSRANAMVSRWPQGSPVTVFFDPARPHRATLDGSPPHLGLTLFFALVLLPIGAGMIYLGITVVVGAWQAPPPLAAPDVPPLRQQMGGLLLLLGALALPIAALVARSARAEPGLLARLQTAVLAPIGALERGQQAAVYGRVKLGDEKTVPCPVSGESLAYWRARLITGGTPALAAVGHCEFQVEDESGSVLVSTVGGIVNVPATSLPIDGPVQGWIDAALAGKPPAMEPFRVELERIAPGEPVLVVGCAARDRVRRQPCLRAGPGDPLSLVIAAEPLAALVSRLSRRAGRGRAIAKAAAVALLAGLVLLAA